MKYLFIIFMVLMVSSCGQKKTAEYHIKKLEELNAEVEYQSNLPYESINLITPHKTINAYIIVIDSCEYILANRYAGYSGVGYLAHKGNCKFCEERKTEAHEGVH